MNSYKRLIIIYFVTNLLLTNICNAQKISDYSFDKYPVKEIYKGKKNKVNFNSNSTAKTYKTQFKEQYNSSKIVFAGKYSFVLWGAGQNLTVGAMVDNKTGNVYDLPLSEENSVMSYCEEGDEQVQYKKNSRLFITFTMHCSKDEAKKTEVVTRYYHIYLWDEQKKKFDLLKEFEEVTNKNMQ